MACAVDADSTFKNTTLATIYALASGQGKCGVAVIRVSGSNAFMAISEMADLKGVPKPRYAHLSKISSPVSREIIDKGLVFWYPAPKSFTGEDVCEFQVHGGPAIVSAILTALGSLPNYRMARPGEFTKRAFFNKKYDLVEAEGIADLINAETEFQRKQAFLQSEGVLSKMYKSWGEDIFKIQSRFEALFNFEMVQEDAAGSLEYIAKRVKNLHWDIIDHLTDERRGERLRNGVEVVILGKPNVGKSTLYNTLCERRAALVTPFPGTTRDVLEAYIDIKGFPIILHDTCGIRMGNLLDPIEAEGIEKALQAIERSQVLILMTDALKFNDWRQANPGKPVTVFVTSYLQKLHLTELIKPGKLILRQLFKKPCLVVFSKCDKLVKPLEDVDCEGALPISLSGNNNKGMKRFLEKLSTHVKSLCANPSSEYPAITKVRHRALLEDCCESLMLFLKQVDNDDEVFNPDYAIMGTFLHKARRALSEITEGKLPNEPVSNVLDEIFVNFCIGK